MKTKAKKKSLDTQITFKADERLKERALKKARLEGLTLKAILVMAMRAYINDELELGVRTKVHEKPTKSLLQDVRSAEKDLKNGDVVGFEKEEDALAHLDTVIGK